MNMLRMGLASVSASLLAVTLCNAVLADEPEGGPAPSARVFEFGGWTLVPVWRHSLLEPELAGLYAGPSEVGTQAGNITRLWFEWDGVGVWTALAVDPAGFGAFEGDLEGIGVNPGLVGLIEEGFVMSGAPSGPAPAGELVGGLLEGDPLLPLVEAGAEVGEIIDLYGLLGQPVAPIITIGMAQGAAQAAGGGQAVGTAIEGEVADVLNCLHSMVIKPGGVGGGVPGQPGQPGHECAWPCVCTTHYGPVSPTGGWEVETVSLPSRTTCK